MQKKNRLNYIISCVIAGIFLIAAFGSDEDSGSGNYQSTPSYQDETEEEPLPAPQREQEPDFTIDAANEKDAPIEIEPDFSMDEETEESVSEYSRGSEIDTSFTESAEPEFE